MSEFEQADVNQAEQAEPEKEKLPEVPANAAETVEAANAADVDEASSAAAPETAAEPAEIAPANEEAEAAETMEDQLTKDMPDLRTGNVIKGKVVQVKIDEALVDVGGKSEGIVPLKELSVRNITSASDAVQVGDEIEVLVVRAENDEGTMVLSKRRADQIKAWAGLEEAFENGTELAGEVVQVVKGGLLVDVGARGFVPASLIERGYVSNLENYLGKVLRLRVIDLDRNKNKVVLSQKAILEEEYEKAREELWNSIEAGQQRRGIVRRLTNFGAFVDVGGADGLLHISEMSWTHINHPSEVVQENEELEVYVLAVDKDKQRISLGLKQILRSPWENAADKYQAGQIVPGKVVRTVPFGAFVQIEPGVEGLVHISQLASYRVGRVEEIVNAGDEILVKILDIKPQEQRMSLSLSQAKEELAAAEEQKLVEEYQESQKAETDEADATDAASEADAASETN
jgi:4-hydroxy-3-methylbut-2-enyl diphosphate reductase